MAQCEAEQRILQAVFEIEIAWGSGKVDLGKIKQILTGRDSIHCPGPVKETGMIHQNTGT